MPQGLVRLKWEIDQDGYYIQRFKRSEWVWPSLGTADASELPLSEGFGLRGLAGLGRAFSWPWESDVMDFIVPRGGEREEYIADLFEDPIYLDLANSKQSSEPGEGALEFVKKRGLLWRRFEPQPLEHFIKWRETLIGALRNLGDIHDITRRFRGSSAGKLDAMFEVEGGKLQLRFQADTLQQFCALQLLHARAGHIAITTCGTCSRFLTMPRRTSGGRPKEYCGDACRQAAHRRRKSVTHIDR